eukprot:11114667-Ditylum_brightwellii.AAC.1
MKGELIGGRHDDYCNNLDLVAGQAYSLFSIHDDPKVQKGQEIEDISKELDHQKAPVTTITK